MPDNDFSHGLKSTLRSNTIKLLLLIPLATIALVAASSMSSIFRRLTLPEIAITLGTILFADLLAIFMAVYVARLSIIEELGSKLGVKVEELNKLIETCSQLKQLMKDNRPWLIDDKEVFEIETSANEEILVIVPDLHYEFQDEYIRVIVQNLLMPDGPTYKYIVHKDGDTESQRSDIIKKLRQKLIDSNVGNADNLIEERFKVNLVPESAFPQSSLYGLAIYRDRQQRVRCLQYMPREFGSLNVEIPVDGDLGRRLIGRTRTHFDRLLKPTEGTTGG